MSAPTVEINHEVHSRLGNRPHSIAEVGTELITVDRRVQQPLREGKVRAIMARGYDPALAGTVVISRRVTENGVNLIVLDGQHRCEAARRSGVSRIDAIIWDDLTLEEEAWLFVYLNAKSNPSAISTFKGRVQAGEQLPTAIANILHNLGWIITDAKQSDGDFSAVSTVERIAQGRGDFKVPKGGNPPLSVLEETLSILTRTWGLNKGASDANVLAGMAVFLIRYPECDRRKLMEALARLTPIQFRAEAEGVKKAMGVRPPLAYAYKIHQEYNKRSRSTKLGAFQM